MRQVPIQIGHRARLQLRMCGCIGGWQSVSDRYSWGRPGTNWGSSRQRYKELEHDCVISYRTDQAVLTLELFTKVAQAPPTRYRGNLRRRLAGLCSCCSFLP